MYESISTNCKLPFLGGDLPADLPDMSSHSRNLSVPDLPHMSSESMNL